MGKIHLKCECGKAFAVPDRHAGKKGRCPQCGALMDIPEPAAPEPTNCRECGAPLEPGEKFCSECGAPTSPDVVVRRRRRRPNIAREWAKHSHKKNIKRARTVMLVLGIIMMAFGLIMVAASVSPQAKRSGESQNYVIIAVVLFAQAAVLFGCFFWAAKNPVPATITALVFYLTGQIAGIFVAISQGQLPLGPPGIVIEVLIISALVYGVKSAFTYKRMEQQERAKHRRVPPPDRAY